MTALPTAPVHGAHRQPDGDWCFAVWAPHAEAVTLELEGSAHALESLPQGWHHATVSTHHRARYGYRLDGGPLRPDPASRWQPDGVHAPSALLDPGQLPAPLPEDWAPVSLAEAAIYELHVGTFTSHGTFEAAIEHLPALQQLGVTHVEVMPVNAFSGPRGWGYDGVGWYAVHEPYGGPSAFARFVRACHDHGLGVLLDVVYNHLGPSGNYLPEFGPYLTDAHASPWGRGVNLDGPGSDAVRAFIVGNAVQWLADFGVDGLRLDAVHALVDRSAVHLLAALSERVQELEGELGRPLWLIAESDRNDPRTVRPRPLGGFGLDAQWADDLHHSIHVAVTGERDGYYADYAGTGDVARALERGFVFDGERYSGYRGRTVGAPLSAVPGWRLVACIQNHDQVGNRAGGERLTSLVSADLVRCAVLLLCTAPHVPLLFQGEEYGETRPFLYFTSHPEPELAQAVTRGRRAEFAAFSGFAGEVADPQHPDTFAASVLDWDLARTPAGRARRRLWQDLLTARRQHPPLHDGRRDLLAASSGEHWLVIRRGHPDGHQVLVTCNLSSTVSLLEVPPGPWRPLTDTGATPYGGGGEIARIDARSSGVSQPGGSATLWTQAPA